jgi:hypothetical protein
VASRASRAVVDGKVVILVTVNSSPATTVEPRGIQGEIREGSCKIDMRQSLHDKLTTKMSDRVLFIPTEVFDGLDGTATLRLWGVLSIIHHQCNFGRHPSAPWSARLLP